MQAVLVMFRSDGERRSFSLSREMTVIGRRQDCDLMIPLNEISRKHCRFIREGDELRLEDLGSSNGTFCNGRRIQEAILQPGDTVQVGPVTFVVQIDGQPEDDEIQPFANAAGGDADVQEIDHDEAPAKSRGRSGGGAARGAAALGAAAAIGAAAGTDDDEDALEALPDDDDDALMEIPDDEDDDGLMELPSEDDLLKDLSSDAPLDEDEEPLDMLDDEPPAPARAAKPAAPAPPKPAPIEDEMDLLEDDLAEDSGAPHPLEAVPTLADDTPLAFDDTPLPLDPEEPLPMEESPAALDTESYRAPGEPPAEAAATYDDVLGELDESPAAELAEDDEPLSFAEPINLAEPLGGEAVDAIEAPQSARSASEEPVQPASTDLEEPFASEDSASLGEPAAVTAPTDAEIPTFESDTDALEGELAESSLELAESDLLGEDASAEPVVNVLGEDFAIGHHGAEAGMDPLAGAAESDAIALGGDDAPLDFSEHDDLLELAEDADGNPAASHGAMNEDELLDLLGDPKAHPHDPNASPTDHSANH